MNKIKILLSLLLLVLMMAVMRWQGQTLVTPVSPLGILNLEFAGSEIKLRQLQLFWGYSHFLGNLLLDFLFIAAYTWFFIEVLQWLKGALLPRMVSFAWAAALFDVLENLLMFTIFTNRFSADLLFLVFGFALIKFMLVAILMIYISIRLSRHLFRGRQQKGAL